jgi:predicted small lipoprotein YifL
MKIKYILLLMLSLSMVLLAGCGQKGPLYLPPAETTTAAT